MRHKKYIKPRHLVFLWFGVWIGEMILLVLPILMLSILFVLKRPIMDVGFLIFVTFLFLIIIWLTRIWKKATFNRKDFVKFAESIGVRFLRKRVYHWIYSVAYGFLNDIYIGAKIDAPILGYYPANLEVSMETGIGLGSSKYAEYVETSIRTQGAQSPWLKLKENPFGVIWNPEYMEEVGQIELISLISAPHDIDAMIKIDNGKGDIPRTGYPEIDNVLTDYLRDTEHFHARLVCNKNNIRFTIIGGSWQGEKFRRKILKGFEVFKEIHSELKKKYPTKSWDDWQVLWDKKEKLFRIEQKGKQR